MTGPILEARGVHKSFRQGPVTLEVLQGVAMAVAVGERIAIVDHGKLVALVGDTKSGGTSAKL